MCDELLFFDSDVAFRDVYTLSLHAALPISSVPPVAALAAAWRVAASSAAGRPRSRLRTRSATRSEEHTSELQSPCNLVCRLLLEKKKKTIINAEARDCCV